MAENEKLKKNLGFFNPRKLEYQTYVHIPEEKSELLQSDELCHDFDHSTLEITVAETLIPLSTGGTSNDSIFVASVLNNQGSASQRLVGLVSKANYKLPHPPTNLAVTYFLPVDLSDPDNYAGIRNRLKRVGMHELSDQIKGQYHDTIREALKKSLNVETLPEDVKKKYSINGD